MRSHGAERLVWLDSMRLMAGLSMVGLHATADITGQPFSGFSATDRVGPMFIRSLLYVARTELFLMISVFLLLLALQHNQRSYGQTIAIQARRLLVPFAFWTVFYALFSLIKAHYFGYGATAIDHLFSTERWAGFLLLGTAKYHMHFIPTLFGLILIYPLFRAAQRHPALGFSVFACLLTKREADLYLYHHYWGHEILPYLVRVVKLITYAGYGMATAALLTLWQGSTVKARQKWLIPILLTGAILFACKLSATWQTIETGKWAFDHTPGYWADFLMPVLLFGLCMCLGHRNWPPILSRLAPYAFGIYLCHPIFLDFAEMLAQQPGHTPMQMVGIKIGLALPLTCSFVFALSHSRHLAWTIGLGPLPWPDLAPSTTAT
ncbi:acyltransferase [Roseovarius sp. EL26]|uniref:acyltransferase n=1 Tax=Roseovarius sp. EL26 TaxID=2126672 RepID=UPI000EA3F82D|nr:acyltransferase [Roseovarius sp. EL26]